MASPLDPSATRPAAPSAPPSPGPSTPPLPGAVAGPAAEPTGGWPAQATETIINVVDQVRSKTTGPALTAARGLVYGLIVAVLAVVVGVLFVIFGIRFLDELLPSGVWLAYLILGVAFVAVGGLVFRRRHAPTT